MKMLSKITIALVATTATAFAQAKTDKAPAPTPPAKGAKAGAPATPPPAKDAKAPTPPAKDAKAPAPAMPTVPAELVEFGKKYSGTWKCTGEMLDPAGPKKVTATNKVKVDLDKWWVVESLDIKGSMPFKMQSFTTYDASAKKWRRVAVDSMGGQMVGTADAVAPGAKITYNLDAIGPMGASQFRDYSEGADPKAGIKVWGELSADKGKTWNKVYEMTCKK